MDEERITERVDATGSVTERTVERAPVGSSSGGGSGIMWAIVALIAIAIVAYFLMNMNDSETRKDDAIAGAASDVGDAAKDVGDAAQKAADDLTN